jgi:hypothetical protein
MAINLKKRKENKRKVYCYPFSNADYMETWLARLALVISRRLVIFIVKTMLRLYGRPDWPGS